jgi:hypothetical protein
MQSKKCFLGPLGLVYKKHRSETINSRLTCAKITVLWCVTLSNVVCGYQRFRQPVATDLGVTLLL